MGPGGIDFGGIGTVITALTGVLLTAGTVITSRQRHSQINAGAAMEEAAQRAIQFQATSRHVGYLEGLLSEANVTVPARPVEMSAAWWAKAIGLDVKAETPAPTGQAGGSNAGGSDAAQPGQQPKRAGGGHRRA